MVHLMSFSKVELLELLTISMMIQMMTLKCITLTIYDIHFYLYVFGGLEVGIKWALKTYCWMVHSYSNWNSKLYSFRVCLQRWRTVSIARCFMETARTHGKVFLARCVSLRYHIEKFTCILYPRCIFIIPYLNTIALLIIF